jgi:hypothetical protein
MGRGPVSRVPAVEPLPAADDLTIGQDAGI